MPTNLKFTIIQSSALKDNAPSLAIVDSGIKGEPMRGFSVRLDVAKSFSAMLREVEKISKRGLTPTVKFTRKIPE